MEQRANGNETVNGLPQLDKYFGFEPEKSDGWPVSRITTQTADIFKKQRLGEGVGPAMVNRSLACLRRMLKLAFEDGLITKVPKIHFLKEPPARKGFLPREKFEELLGLLPTYLRPLILFLYWTGCRKNEALLTEWPQVDLKTRLIRLEPEQTKTDEGRVIPLPSVVVNALEQLNPKTGRVFSDENLRAEWEKACAACGLGTRVKMPPKDKDSFEWYSYKGLLIHDLRRSAVRNLRLAGVSESEIMQISGHKTAEVFRRYNIVSDDDRLAAMRKLETASLQKSAAQVSAKSVQKRRKPSKKSLQVFDSKALGA